MALSRSRQRIFGKGLGKVEIRLVEPTADTSFTDIGYLDESTVEDMYSHKEEIEDENGNLIQSLFFGEKAKLQTILQQTGTDEINLLRNSVGNVYAIRYSGKDQSDHFMYYCFDKAILDPSVALKFKGKRTLPLNAHAIYQDDTSFVTPLYYLYDGAREISTANLIAWAEVPLGKTVGTTKLLDISGFANHGTLSSSSIWTTGTPANYLTFNGSSDSVSFGNVNNITTGDFMISMWVRPQSADGTVSYFATKRANIASTTAGWQFNRNTSNAIVFYCTDGTNTATIASANDVSLQNKWKHIAISGNRSGTNAQIYVNGVASGSAVDISAVTSLTTSSNLYFARISSTYSQNDLGTFRMYDYGVGGIPSDIATRIKNHYNADAVRYGLSTI